MSFFSLIKNKEKFVKSSLFEINEHSLKEKNDNQNVLGWILSHNYAIESLINNYKEQTVEIKVILYL